MCSAWFVQLKTRHLSNLTVSTSSASGSSSSRTTTGSLSTKTTDYTLKSTQKADSAEELASLRPLLPSKSKGGYFLGESSRRVFPFSLDASGSFTSWFPSLASSCVSLPCSD